MFSSRLLLTATCALAASTASAQFSPGPNPITGASTTAQTLAAGTGIIAAGGSLTISGSTTAVTMSGGTTGSPVTLNNSGTISQTGTGRAIRANVAGSNLVIQNFAGGSISAVGNDTIAVGSSTVNSSSVALTNAGSIISGSASTTAGNQAINFGNLTSGTNSINNSGTIMAYVADAVRPGVNGTVMNTGTIMSTALNGSGSDGIDAQTNSGAQITNSSAGATTNSLIEGGRHGITGGNTSATVNNGAFAMSITNQARGTIQGDNGAGINIDGINGNELVTILNNGTITGNGSAISGANTSQDGDGVDVDGLVNLTNTGTIRSLNAIGDTSEGVTVGGGTIINTGTIQGSIASGNTSNATGRGITIAGVDKDSSGNPIAVQAPYAATTITNSGLIKGDSDSAVAYTSTLTSGFSHTLNNLAGGTLEGGGSVAAVLLGPDNDTLNNAGAIIADASGLAIDMGGGNNTLNIMGGTASITGNVSGGAGGANTLSITPGSNGTFTYGGVLSNFSNVQIGVTQTLVNLPNTVSGGRVVLSGANTYTGTTTVFNGATLVANTPFAAGSATGSSTISVQNGGVLAGTGYVAGAVTLASGARLAPGDNGAGTLTLGSNLNTTGGSTFNYDVGNTQLRTDRLTLAGTFGFTGSGQMTFNIASNGIGTGTYVLVDFAGASGFTTSNLVFGTVPAGFQGNFALTSTQLLLNVTAVPEPGTVAWMVVAAGLLTVAVMRRRRVIL